MKYLIFLATILAGKQPVGLDIDGRQHLVVFDRNDRNWRVFHAMPSSTISGNTVLTFDPGTHDVLNGWGEGTFVMPHGLTVDAQGNIWLTDVGLHQVFKYSADGKLLLTLGEAHISGRDSAHFNRPTDIAVAPDGTFYVSDGYRNSRVVKFSAGGKYIMEWGTKGRGDGQFHIPHGLSQTIRRSSNFFIGDPMSLYSIPRVRSWHGPGGKKEPGITT